MNIQITKTLLLHQVYKIDASFLSPIRGIPFNYMNISSVILKNLQNFFIMI